jgi:hypothetical protein
MTAARTVIEITVITSLICTSFVVPAAEWPKQATSGRLRPLVIVSDPLPGLTSVRISDRIG